MPSAVLVQMTSWLFASKICNVISIVYPQKTFRLPLSP
nr:MAG TPA: hypothetical protein [Caudoviricetes sp.]